MHPTQTDICIIGGSYAGLSAALALGRALRHVRIIDSGTPCNRFTPHSHNFLTHDGERPADIAAKARAQVLRYPNVTFQSGKVVTATPGDGGFVLQTEDGASIQARKLLFATGLHDELPPIEGVADCWGISILHCPYCHGYEVRGRNTGILANGDTALELVKLIRNWTPHLTLFTNGTPTFDEAHSARLQKNGIEVITTPLEKMRHTEGYLEAVQLADGTTVPLTAMYARFPTRQQSGLPGELGCAFTEGGLVQVEPTGKTTIPGVYAAGDATPAGRALSFAVASGTMAGVALNRELTEEEQGNNL